MSTTSALAEDDPLPLGAIFSLSKWGAYGGSSELNGALLAEADINAAGGIKGRKLKLIVEDNQSDLAATAAAFNKLVNVDKVIGIVGPNWAEFTEVAVPLAEKNHLALVSPSGNKDGLFAKTNYAATLLLPHRMTVRPLARYLKGKGHKKVGVIVSENAYLDAIHSGPLAELAGTPVTLEPPMRFNQGHTDYRSAITKLRNSGVDALVVLLAESGELGSFLRQARELKFNLPFYASNTVSFDEEIRAKPETAEGVVYFDFKMGGTPEFLEHYRDRFKREPTYGSAKAYDAVLAFKNAIESCGPARETMAACIRKNTFAGQTGTIKFLPNGVLDSAEEPTELLQVRGGKFEKL